MPESLLPKVAHTAAATSIAACRGGQTVAYDRGLAQQTRIRQKSSVFVKLETAVAGVRPRPAAFIGYTFSTCVTLPVLGATTLTGAETGRSRKLESLFARTGCCNVRTALVSI